MNQKIKNYYEIRVIISRRQTKNKPLCPITSWNTFYWIIYWENFKPIMFFELTKPKDYFTHKISMEKHTIWFQCCERPYLFRNSTTIVWLHSHQSVFLWSVWHSPYPSHSHMHTYASTTVYVVNTYNFSTSTIFQH